MRQVLGQGSAELSFDRIGIRSVNRSIGIDINPEVRAVRGLPLVGAGNSEIGIGHTAVPINIAEQQSHGHTRGWKNIRLVIDNPVQGDYHILRVAGHAAQVHDVMMRIGGIDSAAGSNLAAGGGDTRNRGQVVAESKVGREATVCTATPIFDSRTATKRQVDSEITFD